MSKAGYSYDNAPIERYFNTLKNEEIYLYHYHDEQELYIAIEDFAYVKYNHHVCPMRITDVSPLLSHGIVYKKSVTSVTKTLDYNNYLYIK
jgi:orfB (fragment)